MDKSELYSLEDKLIDDVDRIRANQAQYVAGMEEGITMAINAMRAALTEELMSGVDISTNAGGKSAGTDTIDPVYAAGGCRCRDCVYYAHYGYGVGDCERESVQYLNVSDTDFCSLGTRGD